MDRNIDRYVLALAGVSGFLVALSYGLAVQPGTGWSAATLALLGFLALGYFFLQRRGFVLHWRGQRIIITIDEPMVFVSLVALPFPGAVLAVFTGTTFVQMVARRKHVKALFNIAAYSLSAVLASTVYAVLHVGLAFPPLVAALPGVATYTFASMMLVSSVFARLEGARLLAIFRERFLLPAALHSGLGGGFGYAGLVLWMHHPAAALALLPLGVLALSFTKLNANAESEVRVRRRLAEMAAPVGTDEDEVAQRLLDACGELFLGGSAELTLFGTEERPARTWRREFEGGVRAGDALEAPLLGRDGRPMGKLVLHSSHRARELLGDGDRPILAIVAARAASDLEAVRAIRQLVDLKNLHEEIVQNVPAGVLRLDADGRVLQGNAQFAGAFGASPGDVLPGTSILQWAPLRAHPDLLERLHLLLSGQAFEGCEIQLPDGRALSASGVPLGLAGLEGGVILFSDVTARKQAEEAQRSQTLTRPFVRHLVLSLVQRLNVTPRAVADVGRGLARDVTQEGAEEFAAAFRTLGLGNLRFDKMDGANYVFSADDLLERRAKSPQPTCHLALGFLEGAVGALHASEALGTELRCQSQGHPRCVFVVQPRAVVLPTPRRKEPRAAAKP